MNLVAELPAHPGALVHEPGWRSWSPAGTYRLGQAPPRGLTPVVQEQSYRPARAAHHLQGEGFLAYAAPGEPVLLRHARDPLGAVPRCACP